LRLGCTLFICAALLTLLSLIIINVKCVATYWCLQQKLTALLANNTSAALLAVATGAPQPEPWTLLESLGDALAVMEAAIAQNTFLPQLLLYRCDRQLPA